MRSDDEATRTRLAKQSSFWHGYHLEMREVHRHNGDRLSAILDEVGGWPGGDVVGSQGSEDAWFIANHDIANPKLMRRARDLMAEAVEMKQASAPQLAHLIDRILMFEGEPQRYGTQLGWDDDGGFGVWPPLIDPEHVDERRHDMGLVPLAEARASADQDPDRPKQLSQEERDARRRGGEEFAISVGWRS